MSFSCQQDEFLEENTISESSTTNKFITKTIPEIELYNHKEIAEKLKALKSTNFSTNLNDQGRNISYSEYGFTVSTDNATYILNTETGNHSYSFYLERHQDDTQNLENIVFQSNEEGSYDSFLVSYGLTKEELLDKEIGTFEDDETIWLPINLDSSEFEGVLMGRIMYACNTMYTVVVNTEHQGELHGIIGGGVPNAGQCKVAGCSGPKKLRSSTSCTAYDDGNYNDPSPGGGGGSSSGGGGTGPGGNTYPNTGCSGRNCLEEDFGNESPCETLGTLLDDDSDNSIKNSVNNLLANIPNNVNGENGLSLTKDDDGNYNSTIIPGSNNAALPMPTGAQDSNVYGGVHTHPNIAHPMYSFNDVLKLFQLFKKASINNKNEVVLMLLCKDNYGNDKVYAIKVNNITKLENALYNSIAKIVNRDKKLTPASTTEERLKSLHIEIGDRYEDMFQNTTTATQNDFEGRFLEYFNDFGIGMYRADLDENNNYEWKVLIGGDIEEEFSYPTEIPCN